MTSRDIVSFTEVEQAGLSDWRCLFDTLRARYRTGDFATGLQLVNRIGALAEEANHHPDVDLRYPTVAVTLWSHDVGGVTSRDVDLARQISASGRRPRGRGRPVLAVGGRDRPRHRRPRA